MRNGYYHRVILTSVVAGKHYIVTVPFISPPSTEVIPCLCYYFELKSLLGLSSPPPVLTISLEDRSQGIPVLYPSLYTLATFSQMTFAILVADFLSQG